jgi:protein SCO1/2
MNSVNRIIIPLGVFLLALSLALVFTGYFQKKGPEEVKIESHPLPEIFDLEFQNLIGRTIKLEDIPAGFKLIYFGTVYESEVSSKALHSLYEITLSSHRFELVPIFISLDPERDKAGLIEGFLKPYQGRIKVLTGNLESITELANAYGVRFQKTELPNSALHYTIDHSPWMYLTTPDYRILAAYPTQINMDRLKMEIDSHMKQNHTNHTPGSK